MTYADLAIYHLFSHMVTLDETAPVRYPNVGRLYHSVGQQPHIAKWVKERPHDIIWAVFFNFISVSFYI